MRTLFLFVLAAVCCSVVQAQTWSVAIPNRAIYSIVSDPTDPALLYAGNVARTILKSTDGGVSWEERLIGDGGGGSLIVLLKVHPGSSNVLYAGGTGFDGLDRSSDYGETWTNVLTSADGSRFELASSSAIAFHPTNPDTVYAVRFNNGVVYRSNNAGLNWDSLGVPPSLQGTDRMRAITVCPDSSNVLLVAGRRAYVYRSSNGGVTWSMAPGAIGPQPDMDVANFAWSPTVPGTVYATAQYSLRQNTTNGGLIRSTDYGLTWSRYRCTDTSLYALLVLATPRGDEIYLGGNQVDFPPDPGYIKGDSIVLRYKVADSALFDLSNVQWTENEIGTVGTNVYGFAVTVRGGQQVLLMGSDGGLFSSDQLTAVDESLTVLRTKEFRVTTTSDGLSMVFDVAPGESMYRILALDGRTVSLGQWAGKDERLDVQCTWSNTSVYIAELVTASGSYRALFIR